MIAKITAWLTNFGRYLLELLYNVSIDLVQSVIDGLSAAALLVVGLFPQGDSVPSPGSLPISETASLIIQCLNWVFPLAYLSSLVALSC